MDMKTIKVFDTITKTKKEIQVSEEIYNEYRRTWWRIRNNNRSFYKHEIQFSSLLMAFDNAAENYDEFAEDKQNVENEAITAIEVEKFLKCLENFKKARIKSLLCHFSSEK